MSQTLASTRFAIFTMGLPAAGKSTYVATVYPDSVVIDPDAIKEAHPEYDPKKPQELHAYSKEISEKRFAEALMNPVSSLVVDGTGTNAEKLVRRIEQARDAGYHITLAYVKCTLKTSLRRNAARPRVVPEHIIKEKARDVSTSFTLVSPYADEIVVIDTDR